LVEDMYMGNQESIPTNIGLGEATIRHIFHKIHAF